MSIGFSSDLAFFVAHSIWLVGVDKDTDNMISEPSGTTQNKGHAYSARFFKNIASDVGDHGSFDRHWHLQIADTTENKFHSAKWGRQIAIIGVKDSLNTILRLHWQVCISHMKVASMRLDTAPSFGCFLIYPSLFICGAVLWWSWLGSLTLVATVNDVCP